jgi:hypothetical protein
MKNRPMAIERIEGAEYCTLPYRLVLVTWYTRIDMAKFSVGPTGVVPLALETSDYSERAFCVLYVTEHHLSYTHNIIETQLRC